VEVESVTQQDTPAAMAPHTLTRGCHGVGVWSCDTVSPPTMKYPTRTLDTRVSPCIVLKDWSAGGGPSRGFLGQVSMEEQVEGE